MTVAVVFPGQGSQNKSMLDTFQEFGFNLMVYLANLWIVFGNDESNELIN